MTIFDNVKCKDAPIWTIQFFNWMHDGLCAKFGGNLPDDVEIYSSIFYGVLIKIGTDELRISTLAPLMSRDELLSTACAFVMAHSNRVNRSTPNQGDIPDAQ